MDMGDLEDQLGEDALILVQLAPPPHIPLPCPFLHLP